MTVTDEQVETTPAEMLAKFMADAKTLSRRGKVGTLDPKYREVHDAINACLEAMGH